jgi:hypothetical protein
MRVKTVDAEMYMRIRDAWQAEAFIREDEARSLDAMEKNLLEDPGTYWYHGPAEDVFLFLSNVLPGKWARLNFVNVGNWDAFDDRRKTLRILAGMSSDFGLNVIRVLVPAPVNRLKSLLRHLGFKLEGRLRQRLLYNGEWVDAEAYSILAEEIDGKSKKRKRKRRSRRPLPEASKVRREGKKKKEK